MLIQTTAARTHLPVPAFPAEIAEADRRSLRPRPFGRRDRGARGADGKRSRPETAERLERDSNPRPGMVWPRKPRSHNIWYTGTDDFPGSGVIVFVCDGDTSGVSLVRRFHGYSLSEIRNPCYALNHDGPNGNHTKPTSRPVGRSSLGGANRKKFGRGHFWFGALVTP